MTHWPFICFGSLVGTASSLFLSLPAIAQPQIKITTNPPLDQTIPSHQAVDFSVNLSDEAGKPLPNAKIQLKVLTPPKTPWFTTDFPIVEGTTLLELPINAQKGQAKFQLMPPIRGQYQVQLNVQPQVTGAFAPFTETASFRVSENPQKYQNLAILLAALMLLGGGSGWLIGGNQQLEDGEIAPQPVRMILSGAMVVAISALLYVAVTAEIAEAHHGHHEMSLMHGMHETHDNTDVIPSLVELQPHPDDLAISLKDRSIAIVGQAIPMEMKVTDAVTQKPVNDIQFEVTTRLLEHDKSVLKFKATPNRPGQLSWKQQFFDGSRHQVSVRVSPLPGAKRQFSPFEVSKDIDVEAVAPPLFVRLVSLGYFTSVFAIGMVLGFGLRRRLQLLN